MWRGTTSALGYLTLSRTLRTLSGGEMRRVSLAAALGATLVNMLYVLDEPSIGLHPANSLQLLSAIETLRDRDNSVVVVEHEEDVPARLDVHFPAVGETELPERPAVGTEFDPAARARRSVVENRPRFRGDRPVRHV